MIVALLTFWSKRVLVEGVELTGASTFAGLARASLPGHHGSLLSVLVQAAVFMFCFGFCTVYLVVTGALACSSIAPFPALPVLSLLALCPAFVAGLFFRLYHSVVCCTQLPA